MGVDDPSTGPFWRDAFPGAEAMTAMNRGWVWRDGELAGLESTTPATRWNLDANMLISLCRWECEGRTGWGDSQAATWTDLVQRCLG